MPKPGTLKIKKMSVKFDARMRTYCGSQDNLELFWRKFLVAAGLQKWDTVYRVILATINLIVFQLSADCEIR